jgi:hypothetical protein
MPNGKRNFDIARLTKAFAKSCSAKEPHENRNGTDAGPDSPLEPLEGAKEVVTRIPNTPLTKPKAGVMLRLPNLWSHNSSQRNVPNTKRMIAVAEKDHEDTQKKDRKKQCASFDKSGPHSTIPPEKSSNKNNKTGFSKAFSVPQHSWRQPMGTFAPVVPNPECQHTYANYDNEIFLLLQSLHIRRQDSLFLLNNPAIQLKQGALILLERGIKAKDLGRPSVPRKGLTMIIDDCDLYLRKGKIHVATERGLLLTAHHLLPAGVPDTTPVRFNGVRPIWAKASLAQRHAQRIETTTEDSKISEKCSSYPLVSLGDLGVETGYVVEVHERHPTNGRVHGRRLGNTKLVGSIMITLYRWRPFIHPTLQGFVQSSSIPSGVICSTDFKGSSCAPDTEDTRFKPTGRNTTKVTVTFNSSS